MLPDGNYQQVSSCYSATPQSNKRWVASGRAQHRVVQEKGCCLLLWSSIFLACTSIANDRAAKPCSDTLALNGQPAGATPVILAAVSIPLKGVLGWTSRWDICRWKKTRWLCCLNLKPAEYQHGHWSGQSPVSTAEQSWKSKKHAKGLHFASPCMVPLFSPCKTRSVRADCTLVRSCYSYGKDKHACKTQGNPISLDKALKMFELQFLVQLWSAQEF